MIRKVWETVLISGSAWHRLCYLIPSYVMGWGKGLPEKGLLRKRGVVSNWEKVWHMEKFGCGATDYGHVRFGSGSILHVNHPLFFHTFKTDLLLFSYLIAISTKLFLFQPMIFQFFT